MNHVPLLMASLRGLPTPVIQMHFDDFQIALRLFAGQFQTAKETNVRSDPLWRFRQTHFPMPVSLFQDSASMCPSACFSPWPRQLPSHFLRRPNGLLHPVLVVFQLLPSGKFCVHLASAKESTQ